MKNYAQPIFLLLLALTWGSSFILMKKGLLNFSPVQVASLRLLFAGLALLPFALKDLAKIARKDLKYVAVIALLGNGIPAFLFTYAQTKMDSGLTGTLNALTPMFTLLIGIFLFKSQIKLPQIIGVGLGLSGALVLILSQDGISNLDHAGYGLLVVLATLFYAISVNTIKYKLAAYKALTIASTPVMFLLLPAAIYLFVIDPIPLASFVDANASFWQSLAAIATLGIVGTAAALIMFNRLIQISSAVFASSVTYLIPIVALVWGFLDGEIIRFIQIIGLFVVLTGVYLTNKK